MEYRLVIKDYNSLYTIYFTKFCKVLVRVIIIVFNFHIYKELFSLINFTFKIFYPFILNQKALKIGYSNFLIFNVPYTLTKLIIYLLLSI